MRVSHHLHSSTVGPAVGWMSPLHNSKHYQGRSTLYADTNVDQEPRQQPLGTAVSSRARSAAVQVPPSPAPSPPPRRDSFGPVTPALRLHCEVGAPRSTHSRRKRPCRTGSRTQGQKLHADHRPMASHRAPAFHSLKGLLFPP